MQRAGRDVVVSALGYFVDMSFVSRAFVISVCPSLIR